jgi:hypothetical protein
MHPFRFKFSLRIVQKKYLHAELSSILGLEPRVQKSDPAHADEVYWVSSLNNMSSINADIDMRIETFLESLVVHEALFKAISAEGGTIKLAIATFSERMHGFSISSRASYFAAKCRIDIELSFYPGKTSEDE